MEQNQGLGIGGGESMIQVRFRATFTLWCQLHKGLMYFIFCTAHPAWEPVLSWFYRWGVWQREVKKVSSHSCQMAAQALKPRTFLLPKPLVFNHHLDYLRSSGKLWKGDQDPPCLQDPRSGFAWPVKIKSTKFFLNLLLGCAVFPDTRFAPTSLWSLNCHHLVSCCAYAVLLTPLLWSNVSYCIFLLLGCGNFWEFQSC